MKIMKLCFVCLFLHAVGHHSKKITFFFSLSCSLIITLCFKSNCKMYLFKWRKQANQSVAFFTYRAKYRPFTNLVTLCKKLIQGCRDRDEERKRDMVYYIMGSHHPLVSLSIEQSVLLTDGSAAF